MKFRAWHVGLAVWVAVCLGGLAWMYVGRAPVRTSVRAGYVHDPPYMARGANGRPTGASIDVFNEAARRSGVTVRWVHVPAPGNADTALRRGDVDVWPLLTLLPHRQGQFHFTAPWLQTEFWVVVRDGGPLPARGFTGRIGLSPLPITQHLVEQTFPAAVRVAYVDGTAIANAICVGEVGVALISAGDLSEAAASNPACRTARLRSHVVRGSRLELAVAARPEFAATAERLRLAIDGMASDGSIRPLVLPHSVYAASEVLAVYELLRARSQARSFAYGLVALGVALLATLTLSAVLYRADQQAKRALMEKIALEEKLHAAHRLEWLGQLTGGIAHDFNNLATIIIGYAALVEDESRSSPRLFEALREIRRAGDRASDLVRQLLMFSRHQLVEPRVLSLHQQLLTMQPMLERLLRDDVVITLDPQASDDAILIDEGQLSRVVINLVVNASDAMPAGGAITMSTADVGGRDGTAPLVRLSVADTGTGIPRDVQARLFEPFFTTKPVGQGTGLGLSTVIGVVTQAGGTIDVTSAPGQGTRFDICFPVTVPPKPAEVPAPATRATRQRGTILVAEDQADVRGLVVGVLRGAGYDVVAATDGQDALRQLRGLRSGVDLVLSDLVMPHMSGQQLYAATRTECGAPPFLFMSGYSEEALPAPTHALLGKPFTPTQLLRAVGDELDALARVGA
jgi:signal transduction histidine kinase